MSVVIHREAPHPVLNVNGLASMCRWLTTADGERLWLIYMGPEDGYELVNDAGDFRADNFFYLDEIRRWAANPSDERDPSYPDTPTRSDASS